MLVYLNEFIPEEEARISVDDRGFLFADGIYEVARIYKGRPFRLDAHIQRARNGLRALDIPFDDVAGLKSITERLMAENGLEEADATLYVQITRGVAPRRHAFPAGDVKPTVYAVVKAYADHPADFWTKGVAAVTVSDNRWARCDIKSVSLLPNVLANQQAHAAGAFEALFVRDGIVLEGSHSNLFAVYDGGLVTYPASNYVLPGITRAFVFELAEALGIPAREGLIPQARLFDADELFLSGTTTEIMPVVQVDGKPVGGGKPGPISVMLQAALRERV
ncbi:MAG: aminotransferase class IV [Gemmatimonadota bacterium]